MANLRFIFSTIRIFFQSFWFSHYEFIEDQQKHFQSANSSKQVNCFLSMALANLTMDLLQRLAIIYGRKL
jgi:hypothetical protein